MTTNKLTKLMVVISALAVLSGCATELYHRSESNVHHTQDDIAFNKQQNSAPVKLVRAYQKRNATENKYARRKKNIMRRHVTLHGRSMPLSFYTSRLLAGTGLFPSYRANAMSKRRLSVNYSGTMKGALQYLAAKAGYAYEFEFADSSFVWQAIVTKTFDISFMPGASSYLIGKKEDTNGNRASSGDHVGDRNASQFSNLQGSVSVWNDLHATLNSLKSKRGHVEVSESTTSVTVQDRPSNVSAIARYLKKLNSNLSRQVALQVQVLQVDLNEGYNYGINWNVVRKLMDVQIGINGNLASPVNLMPLGGNVASAIAGTGAGFIVRGFKRWAGTEALINAISQQGKLSTITRPRVVTLNNQVSEIDINTQTGYLKQSSTTTTVNAGTTATLTPGTIKTGFTLYLLPKIKGENVYLSLSSVISRLESINRISSNPNVSAATNSQIQLPTVSEKRFNQRTLIPSGATLVLAGFKQLRNEANHNDMLKVSALGGKGAKETDTETVILITPTILN